MNLAISSLSVALLRWIGPLSLSLSLIGIETKIAVDLVISSNDAPVMCRILFLTSHVFAISGNSSLKLMKKRLGELRQAAKVQRYGSVVPISGSDFVREVSQAPPDVWVVVILYKDGYPECGLLLQCLEQLATKYPATKFVKIISTDCILNYPDCNLPTLLVYNNSAVKANYVGLHNFGRRCTPEVVVGRYTRVALVLCQSDPVLNDGQSGNEPSSREAVLKGVRQRLIEKVVRDHEDDDDDRSSSD
ncbi:unnamed protein product [Camellia sinensis]